MHKNITKVKGKQTCFKKRIFTLTWAQEGHQRDTVKAITLQGMWERCSKITIIWKLTAPNVGNSTPNLPLNVCCYNTVKPTAVSWKVPLLLSQSPFSLVMVSVGYSSSHWYRKLFLTFLHYNPSKYWIYSVHTPRSLFKRHFIKSLQRVWGLIKF